MTEYMVTRVILQYCTFDLVEDPSDLLVASLAFKVNLDDHGDLRCDTRIR